MATTPSRNPGVGGMPATLSEVVPHKQTGVSYNSDRTLSRTITVQLGTAEGTNCDVLITDATTAGAQGSLLLVDIPVGCYAIFRGAVTDFSLTRVGTNLTATSAVVWSLGTVAADNTNATLTSTEADLLASTTATLSGGTAAASAVTTTAVALDARSAAKTVYLNFATPDAGMADSTTDYLRLSGQIWLTFDVYGST